MSTTITIHVQGTVLGDEAAVRRIVEALRELIARKDIHVEWAGEVGCATITPHVRQAWQPRTYQRRQHPAPFAGPDRRSGRRGGRRATDWQAERRQQPRRQNPPYGAAYYGGLCRSAWRGGRRSADLHRDRRALGISRRGPTLHPLFWLHACMYVGSLGLSPLRTRFCPDCGAPRTTANDRRTGAAERRHVG